MANYKQGNNPKKIKKQTKTGTMKEMWYIDMNKMNNDIKTKSKNKETRIKGVKNTMKWNIV